MVLLWCFKGLSASPQPCFRVSQPFTLRLRRNQIEALYFTVVLVSIGLLCLMMRKSTIFYITFLHLISLIDFCATLNSGCFRELLETITCWWKSVELVVFIWKFVHLRNLWFQITNCWLIWCYLQLYFTYVILPTETKEIVSHEWAKSLSILFVLVFKKLDQILALKLGDSLHAHI